MKATKLADFFDKVKDQAVVELGGDMTLETSDLKWKRRREHPEKSGEKYLGWGLYTYVAAHARAPERVRHAPAPHGTARCQNFQRLPQLAGPQEDTAHHLVRWFTP